MLPRQDQNLEAHLNMIKFPTNAWVKFHADPTLPWVEALLKELNEKASDKSPEEWLQETNLEFDLEIMKRFKNETGEFLLVKGDIFAVYATECVRTLQSMKVQIDAPIRACFMLKETLDGEEYKEVDETWQEGETYTLYTYEKGTADLAEMLHEQLFLLVEPYPRLEEASELDASLESDKPRQ